MGPISIQHSGVFLHLPTQKTLAVFLVLYLEQDGLNRTFLAELLWPDHVPELARASLRRSLSALRQHFPDAVITEQDRVRWNPQVKVSSDVAQAISLLEQPGVQQVHQVLDLLRGPLLKLEGLQELEGLSTVLEFRRNQMHHKLDLLLEGKAEEAFQQGQLDAAQDFIRGRLKLDATREGAYLQWIQGLLAQQQVRAAQQVYAQWKNVLKKELDLVPDKSFQELQGLTSKTFSQMDEVAEPSTGFVGREQELWEVVALLAEPSCRLLTLHGPGGSGKTRLAFRVLKETALQLGSQIKVVRLEHLHHSNEVLAALAGALGLQVTTHPLSDVLAHLQKGSWLLLLDNFEHLHEARLLVSELLRHTAHTKILITSRVRLGLPEEHLYLLEGLKTSAGQGKLPEALQLLECRVRQLQPHFRVDFTNRTDLTSLCRFLSGLPLALEMAAGCLCYVSAAELLDHLQTGLMQLEGTSVRHQSMQRVVEHSLSLLAPAAQQLLLDLGIFPGGFTLQRCHEVTGATFSELRPLLDANLLHVDTQGRFGFHPLVEQHIKKHQAPERNSLLEHRRQRCYFALLQGVQTSLLHQHTAATALDLLDQEWVNLKSTWEALQQAPEKFSELAWTLTQYAELRGRCLEVAALLDGFWPESPLLKAELHGSLSYLYMRTGQFERCMQASHLARPLLEQSSIPGQQWALWTLLQGLAGTLYQQGTLDEALQCYTQALDIARLDFERADTSSQREQAAFRVIISHAGFCLVSIQEGNWSAVKHHLGEALKVEHAFDSPYLCYLHWVQGQVSLHEEETEQAIWHLEKGLKVSESLDYHTMTAHIQQHLAASWLHCGGYGEAEHLLQQALKLTRRNANRWAELQVLSTLGDLFRQQGHWQQALDHYRECFTEAARSGVLGFSAQAVLSACEVLEQLGLWTRSKVLLGHLLSQSTVPDVLRAELQAKWEYLSQKHPGERGPAHAAHWQDLAAWVYHLPQGEEKGRGEDLH